MFENLATTKILFFSWWFLSFGKINKFRSECVTMNWKFTAASFKSIHKNACTPKSIYVLEQERVQKKNYGGLNTVFTLSIHFCKPNFSYVYLHNFVSHLLSVKTRNSKWCSNLVYITLLTTFKSTKICNEFSSKTFCSF